MHQSARWSMPPQRSTTCSMASARVKVALDMSRTFPTPAPPHMRGATHYNTRGSGNVNCAKYRGGGGRVPELGAPEEHCARPDRAAQTRGKSSPTSCVSLAHHAPYYLPLKLTFPGTNVFNVPMRDVSLTPLPNEGRVIRKFC